MTKMPTTPSLFYFVNKDNSSPPRPKKTPKEIIKKKRKFPLISLNTYKKKKGKGEHEKEHEKETNKRKSCVVYRGVSLAPVLRDLVQLFD